MEIHHLLDIIDAIETARPDMGLFFRGMLLFNLRPSEAAALRRADVRLPTQDRAGTLDCRRIKTHQEQTHAIEYGSVFHRWARECLDLGKRVRKHPPTDSPLIICMTGRCRRNPGGWMTDNLDKATERLCARLGIMLSRPYIIRHSIVSWLDDQPEVPSAAVSAHASHLKLTTTDVYRHRKASQAKPAFNAIEKLILSRDSKTA
ncbi:MAG: hypothetical protein LUE17_05955 [Planctomycetaceae bacterium]|nr:hypothetical protein [Planctomycetaceae bacterium]